MESVSILSYAKRDSPVLLYSRSFDHEDDMSFDVLNEEDISNVTSTSSSIPSASISSQFRIMCVMNDFDRIEEMESKSIEKSGDDATGFYLGFIAAMDHFRFYGYKTATNVRIVIGVKDDLLPSDTELIKQREDSIQTMMSNIHRTYVNYLMNPFSKPGKSIKSKKFDTLIQNIVNELV